MRVLVACEESQTVCQSFRARGHEAYSCDIQKCSGGHPEWHILGDALKALTECEMQTEGGQTVQCGNWDLMIAHPPCTFISNAGARWLYKGGKLNEERLRKGIEGKEFFMKFLEYEKCPVCVENPIPSKVYKMPEYSQVIQPYEYGHPYSKKTCLWLKGLPKLKPTKIVENHVPYCTSGSYRKTHDEKFKGASRKGGSSKTRSKTFPGIAEAMAEQWGKVENEL